MFSHHLSRARKLVLFVRQLGTGREYARISDIKPFSRLHSCVEEVQSPRALVDLGVP